ncbi:MAG: protein-methionine-sulfoxide reductase heme-binding subunit MsrQ [Prosthecobacter sp.]
MNLRADSTFHKNLILINGLLPAVLMMIDFNRGLIGVNPVEFVTCSTGVLTLVFLVLTLLVTPLWKIFGWTWLVKQRRLLGLYAFLYGTAHLLAYLAGDRDWRWQTVPGDVWQRPFVAIGMLSFLLMVPLAVTSTNAMVQKLGARRWRLLHRLTYLVAIGGVVHYGLIVKSDFTWPYAFGTIVGLLLLYRVVAFLPKLVRPAAAQ